MKIKRSELIQLANKYIGNDSLEAQNQIMLKIATARCARVSYTVVGDNKKSSREWQKLYPQIKVLDPDGWDRNNFDSSWNELITLEEYNNRVIRSTCSGDLKSFPIKLKDNYENDIKLHDRLAELGHWSPFEHCAKVPTEDEYRNSYRGNIKPIHIESDFTYTEEIAEINLDNCGWFDNFHGFQSYRNILENETSI